MEGVKKIQRVHTERALVNVLQEALGLREEEKGLVVFDMRAMED
jgi:hypothetical protein